MVIDLQSSFVAWRPMSIAGGVPDSIRTGFRWNEGARSTIIGESMPACSRFYMSESTQLRNTQVHQHTGATP